MWYRAAERGLEHGYRPTVAEVYLWLRRSELPAAGPEEGYRAAMQDVCHWMRRR